MGLFRKRVYRERAGLGVFLAEKIACGILSRQRKWADYLNGKFRALSFRSRLYALVIFCLVSGAYLLYLLVRSIF